MKGTVHNNYTTPSYPRVPFLWQGSSGAIWLFTKTRYSVCLVAAGPYAAGEQNMQTTITEAWSRRLPAQASVVLQND